MKLKDSTVKIQGITTELLFGLIIAGQVYKDNGQELVITSLNDGSHSETSLHYSGNGADLRTNYFTNEQTLSVAKTIKERLGIDYDVVIESNHIHLEYQPRKR